MDEKRTGAGPSGRAILLWGGGSLLLVALLAAFGWCCVAPVIRARQVVALIKARDKTLYDSRLQWLSWDRGWGFPDDPVDLSSWFYPDLWADGTDNDWDDWEAWGLDERNLPSSRALRRLGGTGKAAHALALYMRLPDRYAPDKHIAACLLGRCGKPAVPALVRALERPGTRPWAAWMLGEIGPEAAEAVPALLAAIETEKSSPTSGRSWPTPPLSPYSWSSSPYPWNTARPTRCEIAEALGLIGPEAEAAVPKLVGMLDDQQPDARVTAALALWRVTGRTRVLIPAILKDYESSACAGAAIGEIGEGAVPYLLKGLQSKDAQRRKVAAWAFSCVWPEGCKVGLEPLIAALADKNAEVRGAAASTLGCFGAAASEALPVLEEAAAREKKRAAAEAMIRAMEFISDEGPPQFVPVVISGFVRSLGWSFQRAPSEFICWDSDGG